MSKDEAVSLKREELINDAHRKYVDLVETLVVRAKRTLSILDCMDVGGMAQILVVRKFVADAERQAQKAACDKADRLGQYRKTAPFRVKDARVFSKFGEIS